MILYSKIWYLGYEIRVDPVELDVQPTNGGKIGELLAKGPSITLGYINNEQMNALNFTADGFYRTGDIFEVFNESADSASLKFICRNDELLVYPNGEKFNPIPIEQDIVQRSTFIQRICFLLNEEKNTVAVIEPKHHVTKEENFQEKIFEEINQKLLTLPYFARVSSKSIKSTVFEYLVNFNCQIRKFCVHIARRRVASDHEEKHRDEARGSKVNTSTSRITARNVKIRQQSSILKRGDLAGDQDHIG